MISYMIIVESITNNTYYLHRLKRPIIYTVFIKTLKGVVAVQDEMTNYDVLSLIISILILMMRCRCSAG
jgi:hypothetical protein